MSRNLLLVDEVVCIVQADTNASVPPRGKELALRLRGPKVKLFKPIEILVLLWLCQSFQGKLAPECLLDRMIHTRTIARKADLWFG
jgi:hypothetical protein